MGLFNIFSKKEHKEDLDKGLEKTKEGVFSKLARAVAGKSKVDEEVLDSEYFGCHPCINTSSLRMRTVDLIEKVLPAMEHDFVKVKL